jgi:nucleotide-binding universal stress UspA family protein
MYQHILVPSDGSKLSLKAIKTAARLAKALNARLTAVHIVPPYMPPVYGDPIGYAPIVIDPKEYKATATRNAKRVLAEAVRAAQALGVTCAEVIATDEHPWQAILKTARNRKCDVIVMSSHGRRGLAGFLLGSETTKVLTHSKLPVLVCR